MVWVLCNSVVTFVWQCCVTVLYMAYVYGVTVLYKLWCMLYMVWTVLSGSIIVSVVYGIYLICIWHIIIIWFDGNLVLNNYSDNACTSWHSVMHVVTVTWILQQLIYSCIRVTVTSCKVVMAWIVWPRNAFRDRDVHAPLLRCHYTTQLYSTIYTLYNKVVLLTIKCRVRVSDCQSGMYAFLYTKCGENIWRDRPWCVQIQ